MKTKFRLIAMLTLCAMLLTSMGSAATVYDNYTPNDDTGEIVIEGTVDGAKKGDSITIQILKQGMTSDSIASTYTKSTLLSDFVYFMQVPAGEGGTYSETISMSGREAGYYLVRVNGKEEKIYYCSKESREDIVEDIEKYCTVGSTYEDEGEEVTVTEETAISYLKTNFDLSNEESIWKNSFSIDDAVVTKASADGIFKIFLGYVSELTIDNIKEKLTTAAYYAALNEDVITIDEAKDAIGLDADYVSAYTTYVTNKSSFVTTYYKGKNYTTEDKINSVFEDAVLVEWISGLTTEESVKALIEGFGDDIGVNVTGYSSSKFSESKTVLAEYVTGITAGDGFSGTADFAEKVNAKITELLGTSEGAEGMVYSPISYYDKDGKETTDVTAGKMTAKVTMLDTWQDLYFAVVLYQDNKIIDADAVTKATNSVYQASVTVPADTTGCKIVAMLWTDATGKSTVCSSAIISAVEGEGDNAELTALSVDNGTLEFDPDDEDGVFEVKLADVSRVKAPKVSYRTADSSAKVEITDPTVFPGETVIKVTDGSASKEYRIKYTYEGDLVSDVKQVGGRANYTDVFKYKQNLQPGDFIVGHATTIPTAHVDEIFLGCDYFPTADQSTETSFKILRGATVNILTPSGKKDTTNIDNTWSVDSKGWDRYWWNNWPNEIPVEDAGYKWSLEKDGYQWTDSGVNNKDSVIPNESWTYNKADGTSRIGDGLNEIPGTAGNNGFASLDAEKYADRIMYEKSAYDVRQQGWIYIDYRHTSGYNQDRPHSFGALTDRYYKKFDAGSSIKFNQNVISSGFGVPCVLQWSDWEANDYSAEGMSAVNGNAPAGTASVDVEDGKVTLTATGLEGVEKNDSITVQVLNLGVTSDTLSGDIETDYLCMTQVAANANGGFTVSINMTGEDPGFYQVRINGSDVQKFYYSSSTDRQAIVDAIIDNCAEGGAYYTSDSAAISYLKTKFDLTNDESIWKMSFDITDPVVTKVTENGLFKVFLKSVSELTISNMKEKMTMAAYIAALNENKIDIIDYKTAFGLDADYVTAYEKYVESKSTFVSTYYKGKNYTTVDKVNSAFENGVLLEAINGADAWGDVRDVIDGFGEDMGVNMVSFNSSAFSTYKQSLYEYVLDVLNEGGFSGVSDFVSKVNAKITALLESDDDDDDDGGSGSYGGFGGNGGSGGSGGAAGGTTVTSAIVSTDTVPEASVTTPVSPSKIFSDMAGFDWAVESVDTLAGKGIVSGTGNGKYEPERNVTREEMLVMLMRAFDIEIGEEASDFTDAAADGWYTSYLAAAKAAGFVQGKPDGSFGVGESVTRQDAAVMAYNIAKAKGLEFVTEKGEAFADDADVADYASEAVYALKNAEVLNGKGEGIFAPIANCTRAEAAKIIYTLIK